MTHEEIVEGNKLIAKYMGAEIKDETFCFHLGNPAFKIQIEQMTFEPVYKLHYHDSWDWLMPVIETITTTGEKHLMYLYIGSNFVSTRLLALHGEFHDMTPLISKSGPKTKISSLQATYYVVVEFLKQLKNK